MHFFRKVSGAIETGKGPVRVDQANNESNSTLLPTGVIDESGEYEFCVLMGWRYRGYRD
jgi:hypothetical protein